MKRFNPNEWIVIDHSKKTTRYTFAVKMGHICGASVDDLRIAPTPATTKKGYRVVCTLCNAIIAYSTIEFKVLRHGIHLKGL